MKKNKFMYLVLEQIFVISIIFLAIPSSTSINLPFWNKTYLNSTISTNRFPVLYWDNNGILISNASNHQENPQICSDGAGGAIITWEDYRSGSNWDVYAQKINSSGGVEWTANGTAICTTDGDQRVPQICSDGAGGAIITWQDDRPGSVSNDIYAQKINSSGGVEWTANGVLICNAIDNQFEPQICSDDAGGAIITWGDTRNLLWDIYAQRINSSGGVEWTANGIAICTAGDNQQYPQICSDGLGGAIIAWEDLRGPFIYIYAQRVSLSGVVQWTPNGEEISFSSEEPFYIKILSDGNEGAIITWADDRAPGADLNVFAQKINSSGGVEWITNGVEICNESNHDRYPEISSDGDGGAIITWQDFRTGINTDIYAQRINSSGGVEWTPNGVAICNESNNQRIPRICSDGIGGAIIVWIDDRNLGDWDLYTQNINSSGGIEWALNGVAICNESNDQRIPRICSDGAGGAIITWIDNRTGSNWDIYAQCIKNDTQPPTSNQPADIITSASGTETINWTLYDNLKPGKYRVWTNDTNDNYYIWINWIPWTNDTPLDVPINRTAPGVYNYIIEYKDSGNQFGIPDTVIVTITDAIPTSNQPDDITTYMSGSETIAWLLYDDFSGGQYRVWLNDTNDIYHIWGDWTPWTNNTYVIVPIYRITPGTYNYTIEYYDDQNQFGIPDTVIVTITAETPTSNHPSDMTLSNLGTETIDWTLTDDIGEGQYRIWANDTNDNYYIWQNWNSWINGFSLNVPINYSAPGTYNYTIEYNNSGNQFGIPDSVIIIIKTDEIPTSNQPDDITTLISGSEMIYWKLCDDFGEGQYRIWVNDTNGNYYVWLDWALWSNNTYLLIPINRTATGVFNYTIEYYDDQNQFGTSDIIIVNITADTPIPEQPESPPNIIVPKGGGDISDLLLSPLGLGIILGIIAMSIIITAILIKNNKTIKELNEKIGKKPVSKTDLKYSTEKKKL